MFVYSEFSSIFLAYNESFCLKENFLVFCLEVSSSSEQHCPVKGRSNTALTAILKENLVETNDFRENFKQNKNKHKTKYIEIHSSFPVCLTDCKISHWCYSIIDIKQDYDLTFSA